MCTIDQPEWYSYEQYESSFHSVCNDRKNETAKGMTGLKHVHHHHSKTYVSNGTQITRTEKTTRKEEEEEEKEKKNVHNTEK